MKVDVAIVGAGPAGSVTALLLARAGFSVALFDRAAFPRAKACGDCLSPRANELLAAIGVLPAIEAQQPARIRGWRIVAQNGASFTARFEECTADPRFASGLALERRLLDALLLEAAQSAGVRIHLRTRFERILFDDETVTGIQLRTEEQESIMVSARLVVGADGLRSVVRRQLGLAARPPKLRKVALTARINSVDELHDYGEMHIGAGACIGLAPVSAEDRRANFTLVVDAARFGSSLRGKTPHAIRAQINKFRTVRDRIAADAFDDLEIHAAGPFDWPTRALVRRGAALVGDAAGYYDPFTGQGIYQALHGAVLLAEDSARFLDDGRHAHLERYQRRIRQARRGVTAVQRGIEYVCARPSVGNRCIAALHQAPRAARELIAITGDLRAPLGLLSPAPILSFLAAMTARSPIENH